MQAALLSLLAFVAVPSFAREKAMDASDSPDKHCRVVVAEIEGRIYYRIKDTASGVTLAALPSSYQPENGSEGWAFQQSTGATIHWRKDSRCVAIDEANHRRMGSVLIARRTAKGFQQVPIDPAAVMRASKHPWERGRLFFGKWGRRDTVEVVLVGLVQRVSGGQRDEADAVCTLDLANQGRIVAIETDQDARK